MSRCYAGIGARDTPGEVLALIEQIAARLARQGWVLRTGLSPGADQAFYRGALSARGTVELYLPWPRFQAQARLAAEGAAVRELSAPTTAAGELAAGFHRDERDRAWAELPARERALLARDAHEVLGEHLDEPVRLVVCWTPEGGLDGADPRAAGTGQALRIARASGIEVLNLARSEHARLLADGYAPGESANSGERSSGDGEKRSGGRGAGPPGAKSL
jgi:hypothetical protein